MNAIIGIRRLIWSAPPSSALNTFLRRGGAFVVWWLRPKKTFSTGVPSEMGGHLRIPHRVTQTFPRP